MTNRNSPGPLAACVGSAMKYKTEEVTTTHIISTIEAQRRSNGRCSHELGKHRQRGASPRAFRKDKQFSQHKHRITKTKFEVRTCINAVYQIYVEKLPLSFAALLYCCVVARA
jgi:hypothetical protein